MVDGAWSGGTYVCWGTDNREAPIRLCNATSPASRNFEVKCVDGTSNPYLALAGLIAAGVEGVKTNKPLGVRDCSAHGELGNTAAEMGEEERERFGITQRLPLGWEEAREAFRGDGVLGEVFGEAFVRGYLNVNKVRFLGLISSWN
jgi:glutamine synthetase